MGSPTTISDTCASENIELVRLLFVTQSGAIRAHAVDAEKVDAAVETGVTISELVQTYNALGRRDKDGRFDSAGEVRLQPDPETFRPLPYAERAGAMLCELRTLDCEPWPVDPRFSLRALQTELTEAGLTPAVAFESEFHLFEEGPDGEPRRVDHRGAYSTASTRESHGTILAITVALKAQEIPVE